MIKGNLYLVGGGDPSLTSEGLHELAKRVYKAGIRAIFGKVILDDTLFNGCSLPIHGEWEDLPIAIGAAGEAGAIHKDITLGVLPAHIKSQWCSHGLSAVC